MEIFGFNLSLFYQHQRLSFFRGRSEDFAAEGGGGKEMRAFQGEGREITVVPIKGDHWNSTELNRGSGKL